MRPPTFALAVLGLGWLVACGPSVADEERRVMALSATVGSVPLDDAGMRRLAPEKETLEVLTREIEKKHPRKGSARLDWAAGECHRLRQLFDEPDAFEKSEQRLSLALARDPKMARAHVSLGQLYLTGGLEWAPRAEREFVRALEESPGEPLPAAQKGLFLAFYYQGRWADALKEADRYLAAAADADVKKMKDMAEANLKREKR